MFIWSTFLHHNVLSSHFFKTKDLHHGMANKAGGRPHPELGKQEPLNWEHIMEDHVSKPALWFAKIHGACPLPCHPKIARVFLSLRPCPTGTPNHHPKMIRRSHTIKPYVVLNIRINMRHNQTFLRFQCQMRMGISYVHKIPYPSGM